MDGPVDLSWKGSAFCWLAAILIFPFFWSFYALMFCIRVVCFVLGRMRGSSVPIFGLEAIFAHEETSARAVVNSVLLFAGVLDRETCTRLFEERVVLGVGADGRKRFPKYSRYLEILFGFPVWRECKSVDIREHLYDHPGNPVVSEEEFEKVVNEYFDRPMVPGRPHFEAIRILFKKDWRAKRHLNDVVPESCVIIRLHHSIADGVSCTRIVCEALSSNYDDMMERMQAMVNTTKGAATRKALKRRMALISVLVLLAGFILVPLHSIRMFVGRERGPLRLTRARSGRKHYCWSRPLSLARVKNIKNAVAGCTVNDVIMSCVSGSMRKFLASDPMGTGSEVPYRLLINMPVSVQRLEIPARDKNSLMMLRTALITGIDDPLERLMACKNEMDDLKVSILRCLMDDFVCFWSGTSFSQGFSSHIMKYTAPSLVYSNVPGPPVRINFLGTEVVEMVGCVPNLSAHGLTVAAVSYCDHIVFSVVMDKGIGENIEVARKIVRDIEEQITLLEEAVQTNLSIQMSRKGDILIEESEKDEFVELVKQKTKNGFLVSDIVEKNPHRAVKSRNAE